MKAIITIIILMVSISLVSQNTFKDERDRKIYKTVKIGNQVWMAENLAYKTDSGCWAYNNSSNNVPKYGYLYNWEAAKNVCPAGWHLPSKIEFDTLFDRYGGDFGSVARCLATYNALIPGGKSSFWTLFAGSHFGKHFFANMGKKAFFWSSTSSNDSRAWNLDMDGDFKAAQMYDSYKSCGFSVRCLQD